jgi:hypothetical protein
LTTPLLGYFFSWTSRWLHSSIAIHLWYNQQWARAYYSCDQWCHCDSRGCENEPSNSTHSHYFFFCFRPRYWSQRAIFYLYRCW